MTDYPLQQTATDLDIHAAIEETLWAIDTVRITHPTLEVTVHNGQATVSGVVNSPMIQGQIESALQALGLPELTLRLMNDDAVGYAAAYALATDARTRRIAPGYQLTAYNGHVALRGKLSPAEAAAAAEVIGAVSGVTGVKVN